MTAERRAKFWSLVEKTDGCWLWKGWTGEYGYGRFELTRKISIQAHRFAYLSLVGPVTDGLTLDHLCRNRACVNPAHMEQVTGKENTLRGFGVTATNARKTHCSKGHPFTPDNLTYRRKNRPTERECLTCYRKHKRDSKRRAYQRKAAEARQMEAQK